MGESHLSPDPLVCLASSVLHSHCLLLNGCILPLLSLSRTL